LTVHPFQPRWPWIGADLQTLRDTIRPERLSADGGVPLRLPLPSGDHLLVLADPALAQGRERGLLVLVHGLAGDSGRQGVRRLGRLLQQAGFAVWRLNLRGAGGGRGLAGGTYAAACNNDLLPVLAAARLRAAGLPLLGVGLSLGGTVLLNGLLAQPTALDGLACVSSPLELEASARQIAHPRNRLYAAWLLRRLMAQTLADPFGVAPQERALLLGRQRPRSLAAFDAAITVPRWGYDGLAHYYAACSPGTSLQARNQAWGPAPPLPPILLLHALDDPWVPVAAAQAVAACPRPGVEVLLTEGGGHNGFHARQPRVLGENPSLRRAASLADRLVVDWLARSAKRGR
jgi:predicted alpha/beta-fold hydrolase